MIRKRARGAGFVLLALCMYALTAGSASASTTHVCTSGHIAEETVLKFKDSECTAPEESGGTFHQTRLSVNDDSKIHNQGAEKLTTTIAGVTVEISCSTVSGTATGKNTEVEGEMKGVGSGISFVYSSCSVPKPEGGGCKVAEPIETTKLKSETVDEAGNVMKEKYAPETGEKVLTVTLKECKNSGLNGAKEVTGTVTGRVGENPSLLEFTSTSGSNLKLGGAAVTYEGTHQSMTVVEGKETTEPIEILTP